MIKYNLKETNLQILKHIISNPGQSRSDLAKSFNLNRSTTSYITKELVDDNFVVFKREANMQGRMGNYLYFNYHYENLLFIELTKSKYKVFIVELNGIIKFKKEYLTLNKDLYILLQQILNETKNTYGISSAIFAIHGILHKSNIASPFYNLNYLKIKDIFADYTIDYLIENESNIYSLGFNNNDLTYIDIQIRDGVGSGIILNGNLFKGFANTSGEIGHTIAQIDGRQCSCGNKGCIETYISDSSTLKECSEILNIKITRDNFIYYYNNETKIKDIINRNIVYLSKLINDLSVIINPDQINITSHLYSQILNLDKLLSANLNSKIVQKPLIMVHDYNENQLIAGAIKIFLDAKL